MKSDPDKSQLSRRTFFKTCASTALAVSSNPHLLANTGLSQKDYAATLLVDESGQPLSSQSFAVGRYFVFHYPYVSTPCFLIKLAQPAVKQEALNTSNSAAYQWPGGVGPQQDIVAFAAICAHKLSYMSRSASFISFRPEEITYIDQQQSAVKQSQLIYCCSERSVYEPAKGAKVLSGPATQPLTTIVLKHDLDNDHYYAIATLGGELYEQFFEKFSFRLSLDQQLEQVQQLTPEIATAFRAENYAAQQVGC